MGSRHDDTLVIGHAASGKSLWAEGEVLRMASGGLPPVYVATAEILDEEMRAKAARHAARRGSEWCLVETPYDLAAACMERAADEVVLVDCATMWLTRLLISGGDWQVLADAWIAAMNAASARFVVVTNDVGGGIVPSNDLARRFQTAQGDLNQRLARAMGRVVLVTAGLPLWLKE